MNNIQKSLYNHHINQLAKLTAEDKFYDLADDEINKLYDKLLLCLPNNGKLYKYRNFNHHSFQNTYNSLNNGYIWFSSPKYMNDKIDVTLNLDVKKESKNIKTLLTEKREILFNGILKQIFERKKIPFTLTNEQLKDIINCYTKIGRVKKDDIRAILPKDNLSPNEFEYLLRTVVNLVGKFRIGIQDSFEEITNDFIHINEYERENARLFCMAENPKIESMWAYYGNDSQGFCIEYDFNKGVKCNPNIKKALINLFKVEYKRRKDEFSFVKMIEEIALNGRKNFKENATINIKLLKQFLTKHTDWKHEMEWRIITYMDENKFFIDLVSAIYIDYDMINTKKGKRLINLAKRRNWKIYKRELNYAKCGFTYKELK